MKTKKKTMPPTHPGEILAEEFLQPIGLTNAQLARALGVPARRINDIVRARRPIGADTALRLARFFGTTEHFWLNLQVHYDLEVEKDRLGDRLLHEIVRLDA
jgi:addiction module HigA family antidote